MRRSHATIIWAAVLLFSLVGLLLTMSACLGNAPALRGHLSMMKDLVRGAAAQHAQRCTPPEVPPSSPVPAQPEACGKLLACIQIARHAGRTCHRAVYAATEAEGLPPIPDPPDDLSGLSIEAQCEKRRARAEAACKQADIQKPEGR